MFSRRNRKDPRQGSRSLKIHSHGEYEQGVGRKRRRRRRKVCKSCGTRAASLHNPSQSSVILTTVNNDRDFATVTVGFRSRGALRTNVTSSRDIPRTWHLGYPDERERERERRRRMPRRRNGWLRTGSLRTSSRSLAASSRTRMLAYAIPYGPRTQPAKHNFARALLIQQKRLTFKSTEIGF